MILYMEYISDDYGMERKSVPLNLFFKELYEFHENHSRNFKEGKQISWNFLECPRPGNVSGIMEC